MNLNIPRISITSDTDDTDLSRLHIQDAVTDIEDLDLPKQKKKRKRNKVKSTRNVIENDLTDVENIEGSGDELQSKIISHPNPIKLDDINLDQGFILETYNDINQKGNDQKLKTHITNNLKKSRSFLRTDFDENEGVTDIEDIYASDDEASFDSNLPDTEIPVDFYDDNVVVDQIRNHVRSRSNSVSPLSCQSDCDSDTAKYIPKVSISQKHLLPYISCNNAVTDQEVLSDSADECETKKVKKIRKRRSKGFLRNRGGVTDIEDMDLTAEEAKKSHVYRNANIKPKRNQFYQTESMLYFSDNEDCDFLEPRVKPTLSTSLALPINDDDLGLTDVDNLDMSDVEDYNYDCTEIENKIAALTDGCGEIIEQLQPKITENSDSNENESSDDQAYDIDFKLVRKNANSLCIPLDKPSGQTDVEDLDSDENKPFPVAYIRKLCKQDTDIEDFSDDECNLITHKIIMKIPEAIRDLILIKENQSGKPTVVILALDDYIKSETFAEAITDLEDFSDDENLLVVNTFRRPSTPNIIQLDGGIIRDHQNIKKDNDLLIEDTHTDTEDLTSKPLPLFKPKKLGNRLFVPGKKSKQIDIDEAKTDVEDLTDGNEDVEILVEQVIPQCDGTTDIENVDVSDDTESVYRPRSPTPDLMQEMYSMCVVTMQGSNTTEHLLNFSSHSDDKWNITPNLTEYEDMQASCEEDLQCFSDHSDLRKQLNENCWSQVTAASSKKLNFDDEMQWYRAGPIAQTFTDVESLDDDVIEATEDYNYKGVGVGDAEWDEPKQKPLVAETQGESSVTWQETTTTKASTSSQKAEGDEQQAETLGTSSEQTVRIEGDQSQLSEEMKQLLKEMEQQSKK